jgi:cyclopropane fatty-acyl-phospholipid synthase-like methyltransferase
MKIEENGVDYIKYLNKVRGLNLIDNVDYKEHWGYITAHKDQLGYLYKIYEEGMSFIDLGCGAGNVLRYANNIGYDVTGVDFNDKLLNQIEDYKTINEDLRKLDKSIYKNYDVIFSYRPLKEEGFKKYINNVVDNMKVGGYLITPDVKINNEQLVTIEKYKYQKIDIY